jgi:SAM-dependent methyltransferase
MISNPFQGNQPRTWSNVTKRTKLEIGCGVKQALRADFIGIDRLPLPGVDVVCDLDKASIPFPDNTFDLIYAQHSLEHVRDLLAVMNEIWRISKPSAQLCILAPYYSNTLNFANPYHFQNFNEHTPRFWTSCPNSRIEKSEYDDGFIAEPRWGLARSDHSTPTMDFRCLCMEFFYYLPFINKSAKKLRKLRRTQTNVCHSILYHLVAFKPPLQESDVETIELDYYIPLEVEAMRLGLAPWWRRLSANVGIWLSPRSITHRIIHKAKSQITRT